MMPCVTLPEVEVSELQLGHRVHTPAQAGELRIVEAHVRQVELPGTVMNHVNIASCLVLRQFRFLRNCDSDSFTIFGHFAGIGTGIGAKMNKKGIVFLIHDSSFQR